MFLLEQEFRNNSPVTISWYKDQLTEFFKWLGSEDPADLNLLKFKQYGVFLKSQNKRNGDKLSSSSVHGAMRAVKAFIISVSAKITSKTSPDSFVCQKFIARSS